MNVERWQFSVRSLLILTAIVSIVLAFVVTLPQVFVVTLVVSSPVLLIVAILQAANFATSERRPRLSVFSWSLLGMFFALYAIALFRMLLDHGGEMNWPVFLFLFCVMPTCSLICVYRAFRSLRQIGRSEDSAGSDCSRATAFGETAT